jgi:hypothetical protein
MKLGNSIRTAAQVALAAATLGACAAKQPIAPAAAAAPLEVAAAPAEVPAPVEAPAPAIGECQLVVGERLNTAGVRDVLTAEWDAAYEAWDKGELTEAGCTTLVVTSGVQALVPVDSYDPTAPIANVGEDHSPMVQAGITVPRTLADTNPTVEFIWTDTEGTELHRSREIGVQPSPSYRIHWNMPTRLAPLTDVELNVSANDTDNKEGTIETVQQGDLTLQVVMSYDETTGEGEEATTERVSEILEEETFTVAAEGGQLVVAPQAEAPAEESELIVTVEPVDPTKGSAEAPPAEQGSAEAPPAEVEEAGCPDLTAWVVATDTEAGFDVKYKPDGEFGGWVDSDTLTVNDCTYDLSPKPRSLTPGDEKQFLTATLVEEADAPQQ